jgi:hypothetical protein
MCSKVDFSWIVGWLDSSPSRSDSATGFIQQSMVKMQFSNCSRVAPARGSQQVEIKVKVHPFSLRSSRLRLATSEAGFASSG